MNLQEVHLTLHSMCYCPYLITCSVEWIILTEYLLSSIHLTQCYLTIAALKYLSFLVGLLFCLLWFVYCFLSSFLYSRGNICPLYLQFPYTSSFNEAKHSLISIILFGYHFMPNELLVSHIIYL
jgi:sensor histidine kinase YesM